MSFFAQFCTCFGYFWQKIAYFCIPLHNSAQFCIERPKTLPEICKMTVNTPKNWPPKRPKMTQNGSPKCDQNDVKVMPEWPQIDTKTVQKYPKIIPKWPNFDLKIAQLSLGDVDAARKRPGSGQKSKVVGLHIANTGKKKRGMRYLELQSELWHGSWFFLNHGVKTRRNRRTVFISPRTLHTDHFGPPLSGQKC